MDITFESMDDFTPGAIAKKVEPLAKPRKHAPNCPT